jgi:hypothetical protein
MTELDRLIDLGEVEISRHPRTNDRRLVTLKKGFHWYPKTIRQAEVQCTVHYLDANGNIIEEESSKPYHKILSAKEDKKVDVQGKEVLKPVFNKLRPIPMNPAEPTEEEQAEIEQYETELAAHEVKMEAYNALKGEYKFLLDVVRSNAANMFQLILQYIKARDAEGKFNI